MMALQRFPSERVTFSRFAQKWSNLQTPFILKDMFLFENRCLALLGGAAALVAGAYVIWGPDKRRKSKRKGKRRYLISSSDQLDFPVHLHWPADTGSTECILIIYHFYGTWDGCKYRDFVDRKVSRMSLLFIPWRNLCLTGIILH